jgi:hypothetical protein
MSFLHFWAIPAGAAALSVPFIVHWLTKPRPTRVPLSTVRFVREVVQQRRARNRLRDLLILLLRAAAIALLAAVMARPLIGSRAPAAIGDTQTQTVRVVLLDVSQSMAATSQGIQTFQRARPIAAKQVGYSANAQANLILSAAAPQPIFDRPSTNFSTLVDEVAKAKPLPQRLQVQASLNVAAEMLANAGGDKARRELIVISDFQRSNWAAADFSVLPTETVIQLESVAPAETPANLAILRVGSQGRIERGRTFRLEIEVGNYSPSPRPVTVEVVLGESLFRASGQCSAGGRSILVTEATLPSEGWHVGEARFAGVEDGLSSDNSRPVVLQVHPQPNYMLLTRQSAQMRPSSSYYLERAISPASADEGRATEKIVRVDPSRATREAITEADLLLLDHPGKLSEETLQLLAALLRRGRGLLYVTAEPIDATNLKLLANGAGTSLQMPVEFAPTTTGQVRKNLFLANVRQRQVPFTVFGDEAAAMFSSVRFSGGLSSRRVEGALLDDVLATYNDQSACLVVTACGAGTLAVLNAELNSSNLPSSPAFVPMIGELTGHLLGRDRSQESVPSGEPVAVYLPNSASPVTGLRIIPPASSTLESGSLGELHEENVGVMWQAAEAGPPGVYEVKRANQTLFALASAIPADEADLATLASDVMTDRLSGVRDVKYRSALRDDEPRDDLWSWLAVACLSCVLVEVLGLRLFKS